jgi:hypothetical protein
VCGCFCVYVCICVYIDIRILNNIYTVTFVNYGDVPRMKCVSFKIYRLIMNIHKQGKFLDIVPYFSIDNATPTFCDIPFDVEITRMMLTSGGVRK